MWQHVQLSELIHPWDTLACCWDVKQQTNNEYRMRVLLLLLCILSIWGKVPCICSHWSINFEVTDITRPGKKSTVKVGVKPKSATLEETPLPLGQRHGHIVQTSANQPVMAAQEISESNQLRVLQGKMGTKDFAFVTTEGQSQPKTCWTTKFKGVAVSITLPSLKEIGLKTS